MQIPGTSGTDTECRYVDDGLFKKYNAIQTRLQKLLIDKSMAEALLASAQAERWTSAKDRVPVASYAFILQCVNLLFVWNTFALLWERLLLHRGLYADPACGLRICGSLSDCCTYRWHRSIGWAVMLMCTQPPIASTVPLRTHYCSVPRLPCSTRPSLP